MRGALGWGLAVVAVAVGYHSWGWGGVVLALTLTVFWLLLQFSRSLRVLRDAAGAPVGSVANAVMLSSKLHAGMRLPDVLKLTRSLGRPLSQDPEAWAWVDEGGDEVRVTLHDGRVTAWELKRAGA
jgi:Flp pilus assembly protein TadB